MDRHENISEFRKLDIENLAQEISNYKSELFNLRFQMSTNQLKNPMRIKAVKKIVARISTIISERKPKEGGIN
ncbi:MAG: 50S ribosomal protein L29 [Candidatus Paraimprobicoccus trichonymphae]|uniref:Large ribosomal subunit protein uL29 n=1 Tax=Candidatus Paraimprobicoccus trichonymphae TaxID=3033793 RepID=A0AA48KXS8_9FIRM|nr:MAG: 50S ribosomal protein L29 [Candidatus Paraimprobicoccus trichonymphae]